MYISPFPAQKGGVVKFQHVSRAVFFERSICYEMRGFRRSGRRDGSKTTASNLRVAQPRFRVLAVGSVPLSFAFDACPFVAGASEPCFRSAPCCARRAYWCIVAFIVASLVQQSTNGGEWSATSPPSRIWYVNTTFDSTLGFPGKSL